MNPNQPSSPVLPAMPETGGYTWRALERGDTQALHRLLLEVEAADHNGFVDTLEERERDWSDPGSHYPTDTLAAFTPAGEMAAFGWIFTTQKAENEWTAYLWWELHPEHRTGGLAQAALGWLMARGEQILRAKPADGLPRYLRSGTKEDLAYRQEAFAAAGLQPVRVNYKMQRDLHKPIPAASLPAGYQLVNWTPERDEETRDTSNAAFAEHWGSAPLSDERWKLLLSEHEEFHPELSFLALATGQEGPGPVVGFTMCKIRPAENAADGLNKGWVIELGVRREHRGRGIASALLCASMQAFRQAGLDYAVLGVDSENGTGAVRVYERLGFRAISRFVNYEREIEQV